MAREEFQRRLKAYQAWKQTHQEKKKKQDAPAKPDLPLASATQTPVPPTNGRNVFAACEHLRV